MATYDGLFDTLGLREWCDAVIESRDVTKGGENGFLTVKDALWFVLDPLTQPLNWILDGALATFEGIPWFFMLPLLALVVWFAAKSMRLMGFVIVCLCFLFSVTEPKLYGIAIIL